jgi:putative ABC transport system permease protein
LRLEALIHFYRERLRTHLAQEALAGAGIAVGVALVFAVVVANTSISTSASQIAEGISGQATLQLDARDDHGFDAGLLGTVRALPAVRYAAGILEQRAIVTGERGKTSVIVVGADAGLALLGGSLTQDFSADHGLVLGDGLLVPEGVATRVGVPQQTRGVQRAVVLRLRGRALRTPVSAVVGTDLIGPLAGALAVVGPLPYIQRLAVLPERLTRIFVEPHAGKEEQAERELRAIADDRITVSPADQESRILAQASAPNDQSTELFAAISAIVGLLLAFNAMLLTVPERRRAIAEFRTHGFTTRQIVLMMGFQAAMLGCVASLIGLGLGLLLARSVFDGVPKYLAFAFPFGVHQTVPAATVIVSFLGGLIATLVAAAQPLLDLAPWRPHDALYREQGEPGQAFGATASRLAAGAALILVLATTILVGLLPSATVLGVAALALAVLLVLPAALGVVTVLADRAAGRRPRLNMVVIAVMGLRATRLRSIALAATGAIAVFGSVAIEGAHRDLVRGLHRSFSQYLGTADLWVTTGGDDLTTENFVAGETLSKIRRLPEVESAQPYFGGLLDIGERRTWVIARERDDTSMLPLDEVQDGDAARANALLRKGGVVAVSERIAAQRSTSVGETLALPTPTGTHRYRVVATLSNLGWGPGAVVINADDFRRDWDTSDPTAFQVQLRTGVLPAAGRDAVQRAIGPGVALRVQTAAERQAQYERLADEGLSRLTQISILLLVSAIVALVTATGAAIWQRRAAFADYRLQGFLPRQLWAALLLESGLVLAAGCAVGGLVGVYGQFLLGRWLRLTTGFPAAFSPSFAAALATFALVVAAALLFVAVPIYRAVRAPAASVQR